MTYACEINVTNTAGKIPNNILYLLVPRRKPLEQLDNLINELPSALRRSVDVVVLRAHPVEARRLLKEEQLLQLLQHRFEGRPIWIVYLDGKRIGLKTLTSSAPLPTGESRTSLLKALREAEISGLLQLPGVVLEKTSDYHYEGPSGIHYESFLRIGNSLLSVQALDAIAFWLIQHVKNHDVICFDSPTMLSAGYYLNNYLQEFKGRRAQKLLQVVCLQSYKDTKEAIISTVSDCVPDITSAKVLFVCSVNSRGVLTERMVSTLKSVKAAAITSIALFEAPIRNSLTKDIFCRIDDSFAGMVPCKLCAEGNPTIGIDPKTFQLDISANIRKVFLRRQDATDPFAFLSAYGGSHSVTIHKNQIDQSRHHMIHVDVGALLKTSRFNEKLKETVLSFGQKPDLVLCTSHDAASNLARAVADILGGVKLLQCDESQLLELDWQQKEALNAARNVLLVDDVTITGNRLRGYKQFLARGKFVRAGTVLKCLIGVARTASSKTLKMIADMFHSPDNFKCVEKLLLPDWGKKMCPWCKESELITRHRAFLQGSEPMQLRAGRLANVREGMRDSLFLHWDAETPDAWRLGPESVFGDDKFESLSQAEVFLGVAGTLQVLRDKGDLHENFNVPTCRVLDPEAFLVGRYYAPIICASIFRASNMHDLRSAAVDKSLEAQLGSNLASLAELPLRGEMLFGMAQGKLPKASCVNQDYLSSSEEGISAFFRRILDM